MNIRILRNTNTKRIILVDAKNNSSIISFAKNDKVSKYFEENYKEEIEDYKPK